jgi:trimethylamine---corrinoid protein Co-methyltransferase
MAAAVRGSREALAENPFVVCYPEPISPLKHPTDAVEKLLVAAEYGVPIVYTPCPMGGATAPATIAGLLVQANAETLSGLVIAQLKRPGIGFITGGVITIMDMRTSLITYGAPEMDLVLCGFTDMAHHYGIPIFGTAGCSDAKKVDQQAALESAISIFTSLLSGANLIHDVGYLESGLSFSFNQMVLGDEVIGMARRVGRGIEVNARTLAIDVIDRVGPGGQFLTDDHTLENFRGEYWRPSLMDRRHYEGWSGAGGKTMGERIKDRIRHLTQTHQVEPLPVAVREKIRSILD